MRVLSSGLLPEGGGAALVLVAVLDAIRVFHVHVARVLILSKSVLVAVFVHLVLVHIAIHVNTVLAVVVSYAGVTLK